MPTLIEKAGIRAKSSVLAKGKYDSPMSKQPVFDLHCDLLAYLAKEPGANVMKSEDIGVSLPRLQEGGVAAQVLAIYSPTSAGSTDFAQQQVEHFLTLTNTNPQFRAIRASRDLQPDDKVAVIASIENASGFCEEFGPLKPGLRLLSAMISQVGPLAYISLTHHYENRFGGGNYSDNVGLKADGEALLDFLHGKRIPVDLSHASDALAHDIFSYIDKEALDIAVIASHSNFRPVCGHVRNLPDELAQEVLRRGGLIGINFLRAYIHDTEPNKLIDQVAYGWALPGGHKGLALGADFFSALSFPFPDRLPLFFPEHAHAGTYPALLKLWKSRIPTLSASDLAYENAAEFFRKLWDSRRD